MRTDIPLIMAIAAGTVQGFAPLSPPSHKSSLKVFNLPYSITKEADSSTSSTGEATAEYLQRARHMSYSEVMEIRNELIEKYLSLGRSQEYAEAEVDEFLKDDKRSAKYLDLKRYARAEGSLMGFENVVQVGAVLFAGHMMSCWMNNAV
uniref:Uncharacterized protein n=1 Tax=Eucampia antarctica TaxID=49252 RepID=A0A7S2S5F0_9STRA|mmetsp:Transcript_31312/g.30153  ORF Transcript_31312/g.30153 Transcript_31312/m.30153 type:complete len:149 (+) Transcript_31312:130-576(+)|eukprot:CAMPEP_0197831878 /NCGR_PEP_ID=MMETSP1437-20131217/12564_1 /TAXON_ID=49252 ORGANISM="Eucampia antarctica, Strain CCMP1452" /NCGR_SAMPLE_ID=MMETSP1437 /ASSEMBLY_ACC=CAM_ASM_001096 /LENGTH=148 /DNA_ID=CAMNT_0043434997 /DNA_START=130 /DNA_END=576 /DNA_ORIENTATION=+